MRVVKWIGGFLVLLVLAAAAGLYALSDPDTTRDAMRAAYASPASQFVTLPSGAVAHYRDEGNPHGDPLILIHGSNASLHTWEPWVKILGDQFRVVTVDLPGHGLTGAVPNGDYSQAGMAAFVAEFATAIGLPQFALGGNSMGGGVSARLALMAPERVTKLILVDAGGLPPKTPADPGLAFTLARMPVAQNVMLYVSPKALFDEGLKKAIADDALVSDAMVTRYWELNRMEGTRAATLARFQLPFDPYLEGHIARITQPTLILWGEVDTLVPLDVGEAYRDAIPGSRLVVFPGIGHIPMEEIPAESAAQVRAFRTGAPPA